MNRVRNLSEQTKKKLPNSLKSNKSKRNSFRRGLYPSKRSMSNIRNNQLKELILRKIKENKVKGLKDLEEKVKQIYIKKGKKVPSNSSSLKRSMSKNNLSRSSAGNGKSA